MRQVIYNYKFRASNANRDIFKSFKFIKNRFYINKYSPHILGALLFKQKKETIFYNLNKFKELDLFKTRDIITNSSFNIAYLLYNKCSKKKKRIKLLYNINLYYRNIYTFNLLNNINSKKKINSKSLKLYNFKREQVSLNRKKSHTFLFGYDKYKKVFKSYRKFFISDYRRKNLHLFRLESR